MLKLSIETPLKQSPKGFYGWARYRVDFEDLKDEYYVLGWVLPQCDRFGREMEAREFLFNIQGWKEGMVREIYQENLFEVQRFKVRLYRAGLVPEQDEPEVLLIEEKEFGSQQPLD